MAKAPDPDPDPHSRPSPPSTLKANQGFLWRNLFSDSPVTPSPPSSTTYLEDGTPVVVAPASVLLKSGEAWSRYLVCHFFGEAPSASKIYSDLNPVWGKKGMISVRRFSNGSCLIHVPSLSTRKWILENGLWSSGMVSFAVSEWSSVPSLAPKKLTSASTILTLREVPPQLWSQVGIETIVCGVAKLIPNVKASLPLSSLGTASIRAIVPLGTVLPSSIIIKDTEGASVRIQVSYGRLPQLCPTCQTFGHQAHRCPSRHAKQVVSPITNPSTSSPAANLPVQTSESDLDVSMDLQCNAEMVSDPPLSKSSLDTLSCQVKDSDAHLGLKESPPVPTFMELDASKATESQTIKISFPITPMAAPEPSSSTITPQVSSSSAQSIDQAPPSDQPPILQSPSLASVGVSSSVVDENSTMVKDSVIPKDADNVVIPILEDDNMAPFSFPPLANHSLEDLDNGVCPTMQSDSSNMSLPVDLKTTKERNKAKRQQLAPIQTSLRCSMERHKFKPSGADDKRKRKVNQLIITEEKEIQEAFQEMKEDKTNTCLYEFIEAHKIMQAQHSEVKETSRELAT